jgi:hypothetical protein
VSPKSAVIAAAALAVVGFGVYLFLEVRATSARDNVTHVANRGATPRESARPTRSPGTKDTTAEPATKPVQGVAPVDELPLGREHGGPPALTPPPDEQTVNLKLDNLMELANKHYDTQDFDQASAIASKVLVKDPNNVRMLRIIVSANCIQGDSTIAQQHYERLPKFDRDQMRTRCDRYGVTFKEPSE